MSALTFDTLSAELTQALSTQRETPPKTTARCTLSREKIMVLVEYPLDSASAESSAAQTLDWLEQHLREQFNTTGLPEEMADVSEDDDDEIAVQLYLKHLSESKPFRMRSFTWKVADSFDDLFGEDDLFGDADIAGIEDITERDIVEEVTQAKREAEIERSMSEAAANEAASGAVGDIDNEAAIDAADSFLLAEPDSLVLLPEGEEDLILSELEEDHLNLEIESNLDTVLDLDDELGKALESGAAHVPDFSISSAADLDADLSEGVDLNQVVIPSTPADFLLPGEAIEVNSSEFDLPSVDLPDSIAPDSISPQTASTSSDFFTFSEVGPDDNATEPSSLSELDFSSVFVSSEESDTTAVSPSIDSTDLFDIGAPDDVAEESDADEPALDQQTQNDAGPTEPEFVKLELAKEELAEEEFAEEEFAEEELAEEELAEEEFAEEEPPESELSEPEISGAEESEAEDSTFVESLDVTLEDDLPTTEAQITEDIEVESALSDAQILEEGLAESVESEVILTDDLLIDDVLAGEVEAVNTEEIFVESLTDNVPVGYEAVAEPTFEPFVLGDSEEVSLDEALGSTTLEDAEIDESLLDDVDLLPLSADETEAEIESALDLSESATDADATEEGVTEVDATEENAEGITEVQEDFGVSADPFELESDSFEASAEADPIPDGFVEEISAEPVSVDSVDADSAEVEEDYQGEIDLSDALDMSAIAAGYGLSDLNEDDSDQDLSTFQDGAIDSGYDHGYIQEKLDLEAEDEAVLDDEDNYYLESNEKSRLDDEAEAYEYESEDYDSEDYRDDPNYYLEGEQPHEELYEGDDVALIDEGEVQRQREQWQQQSKSNPWMLFGTLGFLVLGALGYVVSRPCVFTQCDRIQTAQIKGDEAIGNLRADASLDDVLESQEELRHAIRMLQPIPVWSRYHSQVQGILPEYEYQIESLDLIEVAQKKAYEAAVLSQEPPHPVSRWNETADKWREAIAALADISADSPVRSLADSKLVEYRANLSTIVLRAEKEKTAEELLVQAESAAKQATAEAKAAQTLEDWEAALGSWEEANSKLRQIPQGTKAYADAQENLIDNEDTYQEVRERAERERSAARSLAQAKELAADAQRAKTNAEWTLSVERWNSAIYQLNDVPQESLAHSEVEVLRDRYTSELEKAQQGQQVALSFQPVEPSFYFICGVDSLQRCTYSVQPDSLRVDIFEGFDDVIGQSITPPTERGSVTPDPDFVYEGNQLLQQITLLSTQAQLPVELYNSDGQFMARYKPELDGFVKEQE